MCIKIGDDELSAVKGLMTMTLNSIIAEIFKIELEQIDIDDDLYKDFGMDENQEQEFTQLLDEYFDGLSIDFSKNSSLKQVYKIVIETEFEETVI